MAFFLSEEKIQVQPICSKCFILIDKCFYSLKILRNFSLGSDFFTLMLWNSRGWNRTVWCSTSAGNKAVKSFIYCHR